MTIGTVFYQCFSYAVVAEHMHFDLTTRTVAGLPCHAFTLAERATEYHHVSDLASPHRLPAPDGSPDPAIPLT